MHYPVARHRAITIIFTVVLALLAITTFAHSVPTHASSSTPATRVNTLNAEVIASINVTFGAYAPQALRVAYCESGYNPYAFNRSSGASGVFQVIPGTWAGTSKRWYSPFNAWANIAAAHEIFARDGYTWREWACKPY